MSQWVEGQLSYIEDSVYGGDMPAHNKRLAKQILEREEQQNEKANADYVYGLDDELITNERSND